MRALILALFCLSAQAQHAEDVIGIHGPSIHSTDVPNNQNWGLYARKDGWEVGAFNNTWHHLSIYAGYVFEASSIPLKPALSIGWATGYQPSAIPAVALSISFPLVEKVSARISVTRNPMYQVSLVHLSLERKWE